jgi:hypothetical protein
VRPNPPPLYAGVLAGLERRGRRALGKETTRRCTPAGGLFVSCVVAKRTPSRLEAEMIEGARPSEMPGFIEPQLATLKSKTAPCVAFSRLRGQAPLLGDRNEIAKMP